MEAPDSVQTAEWLLTPCMPERKRLNSTCVYRFVGYKICLKRSVMANWKHRITSTNSRVFAENRNLSFPNPEQTYSVLLIPHHILNGINLRSPVIYNVVFCFLQMGDVTKFPTLYLFCSENLHWWELMNHVHETHRNHKQEHTGNYKPTMWDTWQLSLASSYKIWSIHTDIGFPKPIKLSPTLC